MCLQQRENVAIMLHSTRTGFDNDLETLSSMNCQKRKEDVVSQTSCSDGNESESCRNIATFFPGKKKKKKKSNENDRRLEACVSRGSRET